MKDVHALLDDRRGALGHFATVLGRAGVSLEGGGVFVEGDVGHAHFLVADAAAARVALEANGLRVVAVRDVVTARLNQDAPGQMGELASRLGEAGVNIEAQYSDHDHRLILVVDNVASARRVVAGWDALLPSQGAPALAWPTSGGPLAPAVVRGRRLLLRQALDTDVPALFAIRSHDSVARWWGVPAGPDVIAGEVRHSGSGPTVLAIEMIPEDEGGAHRQSLFGRAELVAGAIQFEEIGEPDYRHTSLDLYLGSGRQGLGLGPEAVHVLAVHLITVLGHRRLTIDPAVENRRAIAAYRAVGFKPVGVLRQYERRDDGTYSDNLLMDLVANDLGPASDGTSL